MMGARHSPLVLGFGCGRSVGHGKSGCVELRRAGLVVPSGAVRNAVCSRTAVIQGPPGAASELLSAAQHCNQSDVIGFTEALNQHGCSDSTRHTLVPREGPCVPLSATKRECPVSAALNSEVSQLLSAQMVQPEERMQREACWCVQKHTLRIEVTGGVVRWFKVKGD
ncbi:hypothetical protein NDU88_005226 [Pleurodeles waltl]|uniref:Uncharacterized protein n=1 Tax=Pleurodeles waltl TaxID=8319 RepID=A0AAV7SL96_PLEWA|nr:hypothetical protein NDU88_005226 [Pleurodeles waltl]